MDCVNHLGVAATAYCQSCGKALCPGCVRNAAGGQILCEPCQIAWQNFQQPYVAPSSGPNPWLAGSLGVIPGVGAMYNGQFVKGLIHVLIFAVLVSAAHVYWIFGLFIGAWVLYQAFEAFHTARAMRDGEPLPDPLGLNELGNWLNFGNRPRYPGQPGVTNPGPNVSGSTSQGPVAGAYQPPYAGQSQPPWQQVGYQPPVAPQAGYVDPAVPPGPPHYWHPLFFRRKEPIGAIVLIGLGAIFLLDQLDIFNGRLKDFIWPLAMIALGVWLIVRRFDASQGGPK
jgi:TM2 domain-containing membrane protein YozV